MFPILILDDTQADLLLAERVSRNCKILNPVLTFQNGKALLKYFTYNLCKTHTRFDPRQQWKSALRVAQ